MTPDSSRGGVDAEVARMLRTFEGPETPAPRQRHGGTRRVAVTIAGLAVIAAVGVVGALVVGGARERDAAVGGSRACRTLVIDGRRYRSRQVPLVTLGTRRAPGRAVLRCGDTLMRVTVRRVGGIDPRVAVARPELPDRIYVAAGICDRAHANGLIVCLRTARTP